MYTLPLIEAKWKKIVFGQLITKTHGRYGGFKKLSYFLINPRFNEVGHFISVPQKFIILTMRYFKNNLKFNCMSLSLKSEFIDHTFSSC